MNTVTSYQTLYEPSIGAKTNSYINYHISTCVSPGIILYSNPQICSRSRTPWATAKHMTMPVIVGIRKDSPVHFKLRVSLRIVRRVVAQGKWFSENSMVQTAVSQVHPL